MEQISFMLKKEWDNQSQIHESDSKVTINPLRTSSIFHFTKDIDRLFNILIYGILPNYCSETLYHDECFDITLGFPMVSFCDIPLSRTYKHTEDYGSYAIGLATEYAESHEINPVSYILQDKIIRDAFPAVFSGKCNYAKSVLPISMQGLLKRVYGDFKECEINNYYENEWRYFVRPSKELPWFRTMDDYMDWRGKIGKPKPNPLNNHTLVVNKLVIECQYINYIIVKEEKEVPSVIDFLLRSNQIGGDDAILSEKDKLYLINHVTSFERIRRDS